MSLKTVKPFRPALLAVLLLALFAGPVRSEAPILRIEPGGPTARVQDLLFTPDGRELISVGFDKAVRLWDVETGNQIAVLHGQIGPGITGRLFAAALSPDSLLAVAGYDLPQPAAGKTITGTNDIHLIDLKTRQAEAPLIGHRDTISALVFLNDGARLASGSLDGTIIIWDVANRKPVYKLEQGSGDRPVPVSSLALSPDGRLLASCGYEGRVKIWNAATGKLDREIKCSAQIAAWSERNVLATGEESGQIRIWNPDDGKEIGAPVDQGDGVTSLAFTPDGTTLLSGGGEHPDKTPPRVHFWTIPNLSTPIPPLTDHHTTVLSLACSPTEHVAASADGDGVIELWDTRTGTVTRELEGTGAAPVSIAWMGNRQVAWGVGTPNDKPPEGRPLQFSFDLSKGALGSDLAGETGWTRPAIALKDLSLTLNRDKNVVEVQQGSRIIKTIAPSIPDDRVESAAFTPAGDVVIGSDFALGLYHLTGNSRAPAISFVGHDSNVWAVGVSPDGAFLASASADQTVRIWSLQPGAAQGGIVQPLLSIFRDRDARWVAWTPLGYYNASPTGDDLVGWQINRGLDHLADYYQASRFRSLYYRPDIIARLPETGDVARAVAVANASLAVPTHPRAPVIQVVSPAPDSVQRDRDIEVRAQVTDPVGRWVPRVTVFVNNQEAPETNVTRAPDAAGVWIAHVRLANGSNTLLIHAINDAGVEQVSTLALKCQPAIETSGNPPPPAPVPPQIRIVSPADGATVTDTVTAIKAAITDQAGGTIRRVTLLLNGQEVSVANPVFSTMDPDGSNWGQGVSLDGPDNTLEVRAEDDRGVQGRAVIHLKFARALPPPPAELETVEPPRVKILGLEDNATVNTPELPIRVEVVDFPGGKSALLSISANAVIQEESRPVDLPSKAIELPSKAIELPSKAVELASGAVWTPTVKLNPGKNVIEVRAQNAAGVLGTPTKVMVNLLQAAPREPDLYLLAVGISAYGPPVPPLHYAAADAAAFARVWQSQEGKEFHKVTPMVLSDAQADKAGIEKGLAWLAQSVQPGDWAIVFASGHGASDAALANYYFAPYNFDPNHADKTGVDGSEFYTTLEPLPGTRMLVLDTCHAALASETPYRKLLDNNEDHGVMTFYSSTPTTDSYEVPDAQHGAFTQALIDALEGKNPNFVEDHEITVTDLADAVQREVRKLTDGRQHTTSNHQSYSDDMVLARTN